jgi:aryl-alcohol dehydrogenase-like predicted oxidoreductase
MSFGGDADEAMSEALFKACRSAGVNVFDCADIYAGGRSEEILGRLIKDCREEVLITSKVYFATSQDVNGMGASRRRVMYAVEASLRRLQTDRIDVYYVHRFDDRTPLEETLRAFDDLVRQGKVVYTGASNFAAWQVMKGLGISAKEGLAAFACIQPMYNLVKRQAESEILPLAASEGLGVFPYSPLGGGLLSGKYGVRRRPDSGRLLTNKIYGTRYGDSLNFEVADRFTAFARARGFDPAALAGLGGVTRGHGADHRGLRHRSDRGPAFRRGHPHDPGPAGGDLRPVARAGPGYRQERRAHNRQLWRPLTDRPIEGKNP